MYGNNNIINYILVNNTELVIYYKNAKIATIVNW